MFKVISDMITHWYDTRYTIFIAINFCKSKKMNCAIMFIREMASECMVDVVFPLEQDGLEFPPL